MSWTTIVKNKIAFEFYNVNPYRVKHWSVVCVFLS